jgi:hypothetical protein
MGRKNIIQSLNHSSNKNTIHTQLCNYCFIEFTLKAQEISFILFILQFQATLCQRWRSGDMCVFTYKVNQKQYRPPDSRSFAQIVITFYTKYAIRINSGNSYERVPERIIVIASKFHIRPFLASPALLKHLQKTSTQKP